MDKRGIEKGSDRKLRQCLDMPATLPEPQASSRPSTSLNPTNMRIIVGILFGFIAINCCRADQLAYLDKGDAIRVAENLRSREILVTYCSQCENDMLAVWLISHAEAHYTGHGSHYEVLITVRPLMESIDELEPSQVANGAHLISYGPGERKLQTIPIDLAYTYIWVDDEWVCAGIHFGLPCEVSLERFSL